MTFAIILLFISLGLAFGMIGRKLWQLRSGRAVYNASYELEDWTEISIESMRNELTDWVKFAIHHGILLALKLWIILVNKIKQFDKKIKEKLTHLLHKNGHLPAGKSTSPYLKQIREHKNALAMEALQKEAPVAREIETVENKSEIQ